MEQEQRSYVVAIDYNEQYRTNDRCTAKAFYNLVDEWFDREVDGLKKQLIQVEADGWESKVLFEDVIHCPKGQSRSTEDESEEDMEEEPPVRRDDEVLGLPAQDSAKAHQEDANFVSLGRVQS